MRTHRGVDNGGDRDLLSPPPLVCMRDDLKVEVFAGDEESGVYGFADGLASGDGYSRYRTVRDKEHTDE